MPVCCIQGGLYRAGVGSDQILIRSLELTLRSQVHRGLLARRSEPLRDMFSLPKGTVNQTEGASERVPIRMPDSLSELRSLLWIIYDPYV